MASAAKNVLVYGGGGALGRTVVSTFRKANAAVVNVDLVANDEASQNIVLAPSQSAHEQRNKVFAELEGVKGLDAVICVAGGWAGGNASSPDLLQKTDTMISSSLYASLIAASVASSEAMKPNGCLLLPGAAPLLDLKNGKNNGSMGTGFMIPYGVAKAGVHQLLNSLSADAETAGLRKETKVFGIAPVTIDTPMNRQGMPEGDFSKWTPLQDLAEQIVRWTNDPSTIEHGKMYLVETADGVTKYT